MKAVVIQHVAFETLGNIEKHLAARNIEMVVLNAAQDNLIDLVENQPDILIILGGPISVNDHSEYPFLEVELTILKQRISLGLPTLGICLGAQLIATALGAKVYPGKSKEIGWAPLAIENIESFPAIRHLSPKDTKVLHWHGETFDLPEGAIRLASTPACRNQAFIYGDHTLALQFHPEAVGCDMESWFVGHTFEIASVDGISVPQLREETKKNAGALSSAARKFWPAWLETVMAKEGVE